MIRGRDFFATNLEQAVLSRPILTSDVLVGDNLSAECLPEDIYLKVAGDFQLEVSWTKLLHEVDVFFYYK